LGNQWGRRGKYILLFFTPRQIKGDKSMGICFLPCFVYVCLRANTKTIVLANNSLSENRFLKEMFSQVDRSLKLDIVHNGRQVLNYLTNFWTTRLPCLVILDFELDYISGPEVLRALNGETTYSTLPKLVWSGFYTEGMKEQCIQAGANSCFPKPSRPSELKGVVMQMLEFCRQELLSDQ
jgi:CheY-like chemotaxis protein